MNPRGYHPPDPQQSVTAPTAELAHRNIDLNDHIDREYLKAMTVGSAASAGSTAWKNWRSIGEVRYAIARSARIAGYATLRGQKVHDSGTPSEDARDGSVVAEIISEITARWGGTRGLIERFYTLRKVPGEMYFTAVRDGPEEMADGYWFLSPSELSQSSSALNDPADDKSLLWTTAPAHAVVGDKSAFTRRIQPADFRGRVWAPDAEYLDLADTPMAAIANLCAMLNRLTDSIMERLNQRFIHSGILLIPNEIQDSAIAGSLPGQADYGTNDKVLRYLIHVMTTNVKAQMTGEAKGRVPILMKGPADVLDNVRHLTMTSTIDEVDLKLRAELLDRILDGLDNQKGTVTEGSNDRFTQWNMADSERRITVQPDLEMMCHAVTRLVLWRELQARGWQPARIRKWRVWYDISQAAVKANLADEARQGWDRGAVSGAFLRSAVGASDADVMDPEEYVRWVGQKIQNPVLMTYGLDEVNVDWEEAGRWGRVTGPAPNEGGDDPQSNPGVGNPGAPDDDSVDDGTPEDDGS